MDAAYQSMASEATGVADMVTVPVEHLAAFPADGDEGNALTVAVTAVLLADTQPEAISRASA